MPPGRSHKFSNIMHKLKKSTQPLFFPALSSVSTVPYVKVTVESDHYYWSRAYLKEKGAQPHDEFQLFAIERE